MALDIEDDKQSAAASRISLLSNLQSFDVPESTILTQIPKNQSFRDFYALKKQIGVGSFGSVFLCEKINESRQTNFSKLLQERSILKSPRERFYSINSTTEAEKNKSNNFIMNFFTFLFQTCSPQIEQTKTTKPDSTSSTVPTTTVGPDQLNLKSDKYVAVKIIKKQKEKSSSLLNKFGVDLLKTALLHDHPNITKFIEFLEDDSYIYIVMQAYDGPDLFDYVVMNRGRLNNSTIALIILQILEAIKFIHELGGMHRDIKPENFMFESPSCQRLKLLDFGSACSTNIIDHTSLEHFRNPKQYVTKLEEKFKAGQIDSILRRKLSVVGTTGYCAPEVFSGSYGEKIDIFAAGVVLFILVNGEMPFECKDVQQYRRALVKCSEDGIINTLSNPYHVRGNRMEKVDERCADLLFRMLEPDPSERITAIEALRHDWIQDNVIGVIDVDYESDLKRVWESVDRWQG